MAAQQGKVEAYDDALEAYDGILIEKDNEIARLKEDSARMHADNRTFCQRDVEAQIVMKQAQIALTTARSEIIALHQNEEKQQQNIKEQHVELIRLKSIISANRFHRHELQKFMAESEVCWLENFIKTKDFELAMGEMVFY